MAKECELTILMPCLNEERTIRTCIDKAFRFLNENNINGEILIADNGSTDKSVNIADKCGARIIEVKEKGYGRALAEGIKMSKGKYVIMGDCDESYDFLDIMKFLIKLREGYDLVVGNRFKGEIKKGAMPLLHRYFGTPVISYIGKVIYKSDVGDYNCGLRGFKREAILNIKLTSNGMEYASEMIIKAALNNLKIAEVPITLYKDGRLGPSHLRTFRDGIRHLKILLFYCNIGRN